MKQEPTRKQILAKCLHEFFLASISIVKDNGGIIKHLSKAEALIELLDFNETDYDALVIRVTGYKLFDRFLAAAKKYHHLRDFDTETMRVYDLVDYFKRIEKEMHSEMIANIYKYGTRKNDVVISFEEEVKESGETERVLNLIKQYQPDLPDYNNSKRNLVLNRLFHHTEFTKEEKNVLTSAFNAVVCYPVAVPDNRPKMKAKWRVKFSDAEYSDESYRTRKLAEKTFE
jgi:hypothetical protein